MKTFKKFVPVFIISLIFISLNSCKKDDSSNPVTPVTPTEDKVVYQVEYSENTQIIPSAMNDAFVSIDSTETNFRFDADKLGNIPKVGDIIIAQNKYLKKVISVNGSGSNTIVETENAALTEAIKNGTIQWQVTPKLPQIEKVKVGNKTFNFAKESLDGITFEFDLGNWHYNVWMKSNGTAPSGEPNILVNFVVTNHAIAGGKITATLGAKGSMRLPQQSATINITNNSLSAFNCNNKSMRSELTLEYAATFSEGGGTAILDLPAITFQVPLEAIAGFPIPLPIYVNFGISFNTYINLPSVTATAFGKCKLILDSNTGFNFSGTALETSYQLNENEVGDLNWDIGDMSLMPAPAEVRHELSAPKVGIEVAGTEIIWAACIYGTRSKLMVPSLCKAALDQIRLDAGYKMGLLGITIAEDSKNLWHLTKEYYSPECE